MMARLDFRGLTYCLRIGTALAALLVFVLILHGCARLAGYKPPPELIDDKETGIASYYAKQLQFRKTASGEPLNNDSLTAAHRTLPFGTEVIVRNVNNGKSVKVRINDRGPFVEGRIIDLTRAAFSRIASLEKGVAKVEIRVVK
jgi:rare lipoprotein A